MILILVSHNVEFRVYEGLLAALSPVFKDMFLVDGHAVRTVPMGKVQAFPCPVVHVPDSPEDLRYLLRVCFSKRLERCVYVGSFSDFVHFIADDVKCSLYDEREPSFNEISAAIRLGNKYKITELYAQSLEYLKCYFPSNFDKWHALKDYTPPGWELYEELGVVSLARLTGEFSLLPAAFIACICAPSADPETLGIGHGFTCEDGSEERLSPGDLTVCLEGKTRLRAATITAFLRTFKPTISPACETPPACKKALRSVLLNLEERVDDLVSGDPLTQYERSVGPPENPGIAVCSPRTIMVRERSSKERKDVWGRLPELLGIDVPGWGEEPSQDPQGDAT